MEIPVVHKESISDGGDHPKIFPILKNLNTHVVGEHSAHLSRFRNGWTGYEQLAGSKYASTKRAEVEKILRSYTVKTKE